MPGTSALLNLGHLTPDGALVDIQKLSRGPVGKNSELA